MSDPTLTSPPEPDPVAATVAGDGAAVEGDAPSPPSGYELHSLIGSGGMGAVYRARHLSLTRDVAIKFLLARYAPDSVTAWRFLEEARITARLQHPGIPPVHEVGTLPDGRPYLAMKLIKGHTLDDLLKARQSPADDRGRFVGVFEQVAQAVAFAHSRRIIHRDLKPANVMVGDFGEVQVMDWGLAKELGDGAPAAPARGDETLSVEVRPGRDGGEVTQAGSLLGTPAFMPPEQAIGAVDQIDERSDVFGLGAILCVVLTGQPPFIGITAEATRQLAARGKLDDAHARLDACGAEPELIALAKRCLSAETAARPADAGEVARAVATLRADAERRARQAEMDRATAEVKAAEQRKRRRVQLALTLAVLTLLAGAGLAGWWLDSEHKRQRAIQQAEEFQREVELTTRRQTTNFHVSTALLEVQVLREQGLRQADDPERWALTLVAARAALKQAEGLLDTGEATDELRARVATTAAELDRDDRDRALLAELDCIADANEVRLIIPISFTSVTSRRYATAFRAAGFDLTQVTAEEAVAWLKAHRFRDRLVLAIRSWSFALPSREVSNVHAHDPLDALTAALGAAIVAPDRTRPNLGARFHTILAAVIDDPFTREWWDAVARMNLIALRGLVARPELQRVSSRQLASLSDGLTTFGSNAVQGELMALAHERFPGEFWVHFRLAFLAEAGVGRTDGPGSVKYHEALRHLTAAVAARPRSAIARAALGMELLEKHKDPTGLKMLKSAVLVDPSSPWPHIFLGMEAVQRQNWAEAATAFTGAVRADPDTAFFMIHTTILSVSLETPAPGTPKAAPDEHLTRLIETIAAANPGHPGSSDLLGQLYTKTGDFRAALAAYRKANLSAEVDYPRKPLLTYELGRLEAIARWEGEIDAILAGRATPTDPTELAQIAGYLALFDKKYARAADFAARSLRTDPTRLRDWGEVAAFAGWAVQAASGNGADAADLTPVERARLRGLALAWLRESVKPNGRTSGVGTYLYTLADLHPVRSGKEIRKLPPAEQDEWIKFWLEVGPSVPEPDAPPRDTAPPPREVKR